MKRLSFCALSLLAMSLSGCCGGPGYLWPWNSMGGGCGSGSCPPPMTGYNAGYDTMQAAYPVQGGAIAAQPFMPTQVAYPQQMYPTMAVEALPTYR